MGADESKHVRQETCAVRVRYLSWYRRTPSSSAPDFFIWFQATFSPERFDQKSAKNGTKYSPIAESQIQLEDHVQLTQLRPCWSESQLLPSPQCNSDNTSNRPRHPTKDSKQYLYIQRIFIRLKPISCIVFFTFHCWREQSNIGDPVKGRKPTICVPKARAGQLDRYRKEATSPPSLGLISTFFPSVNIQIRARFGQKKHSAIRAHTFPWDTFHTWGDREAAFSRILFFCATAVSRGRYDDRGESCSNLAGAIDERQSSVADNTVSVAYFGFSNGIRSKRKTNIRAAI